MWAGRRQERFISKKSGNTNLGTKGILLPDDYPNLDPVKFPKLSKYNNMQGTYQGMTIRNGFQRNQDRIYAAGENQNANEYVDVNDMTKFECGILNIYFNFCCYFFFMFSKPEEKTSYGEGVFWTNKEVLVKKYYLY